MESFDPATGEKLPQDAIQRILFIGRAVHVYNIPPLASTKGYTAATWTEDPQRHIFTCRLRVIETALPQADGKDDKVKTDIILEDASTGQLFAAAPYVAAAVVESALDSSRFFALRVQDPSGRKATLGIGFEERSDAFDFGVALQDAQKAMGLDGGAGAAAAAAAAKKKEDAEAKRDLSLKEGETITVNLGGKFGRKRPQQEQKPGSENVNLSSFSLPPPPSAPGARGNSLIPPPPSTQNSEPPSTTKTAEDLGFDDGANGEFA